MNLYIKEEFKRAIYSKNFFISFALCLICIIIGSFESIYYFGFQQSNAYNLFMLSYSEGTNAILSMIFALIVSIPYVASYLSDINTGHASYIILRAGKMNYLLIRLIINAIVGGIVLSISLMITFIVYLLLTGFSPAQLDNVTIVFAGVYNLNPFIYILLLVINSFFCGAAFSTFGLGMSTIIKNRYLCVIFPFLFYIFSGTILNQINPFFNSVITYDLNFIQNLNYSYVLLYELFLFGIGMITFFVGANKHAEDSV